MDQIKGIGDKTKVVLLRKYKSIKRIRETDESELIELIGEAKAKLIKEGLKGTEK